MEKCSSLDLCCLEIDAYRQITGQWISYGDYMARIRPNLSKEEYAKIKRHAEVIDKNRKRSLKRGKANSVHSCK